MRFAGELIDTETSLYHLRARQYDPGSGRFLSVDPLSPELVDPSASAYVSADNDPTALIDPSGLWCHSVLHCLNAIGSFIERHPVTVGGCASASLSATTRQPREVWASPWGRAAPWASPQRSAAVSQQRWRPAGGLNHTWGADYERSLRC